MLHSRVTARVSITSGLPAGQMRVRVGRPSTARARVSDHRWGPDCAGWAAQNDLDLFAELHRLTRSVLCSGSC